jgi:hypothetical protein
MQQAVMPGDIVNIAGWGDLTEDGESPDVLHEVQLPIVDQATCNAPTAYNGDIDESQLCAGLPEGGKDSCQGDSGGPLWVNYQGQDYLAGVVSYGEGCARPNKYGVYTRVERYDAWTQSILDGTDITPPMCEEVVEQEANNLIHWQDAGTVSLESCLSISGEIRTGYDNVNQPNPTADVDGFEFQAPVGAYLKVTFDGLDRTDHVSFGLFDLTYQLAVPMYCGQWQGTSMVCEATATSGWLAIGLSSRLAEDYTIDIQVEAGQKRSIFERLEDRMPHDSRTILEIAERLNN